MERCHDAADQVLCVVSDDYLKAPYPTLECNLALWQVAEKRPGFVLMVAVRPCRLPTLSDHIRRCELHGVPEEAARQRFRDFMSARGRQEAAAFPGRPVAVSNIPIRVPTHFMGRDDALATIAVGLDRYEGRIAITALHGLRGVGKTTLAAGYAEAHRADYRATWWIRAQTVSTMRADLVALEVRPGWVAAEGKEEPAFAAVMERLRHEGEGLLIVYDNAVDARSLKDTLPRGGGARVLITSNDHAWRSVAAEPVEIRLWPKEVGTDYLRTRTGRADERVEAEALSHALGGLLLRHEQAAAYCEQLGVSIADYGRRFAAALVGLLDDDGTVPGEYHDGLTVAKTFSPAIAEAAKLHPAAEPLLLHAALLAPEPIPLFLFAERREALGEPLASLLAGDELDRAVAKLRMFALVYRETITDERDPKITTDCVHLHRLVREVAKGRCTGTARDEIRQRLVEASALVYPRGVFSNHFAWPRARRLDAIALALVPIHEPSLISAEMSTNLILDGLASHRHAALAAYGEARHLFERALTFREAALGSDHRETAMSLNSLAVLLQEQRDLAAARPLLGRALVINETALGLDHPDTARSLNNLAALLQIRGDLAAALPLVERALAIYETALGPEHPDTAKSLNNLGCLLRESGNVARAELSFSRAITVDDRALGANHSLLQRYRSHYARLLLDTGRAVAARETTETALATHAATNGPDHPWTKDSARVLADTLDALGDAEQAAALRARHGLAPPPASEVSI